MTDLNKLSPAALSVAMRDGTANWGQWGSAEHHALYIEKYDFGRRWRMCRCGCRKRSTHLVMANGVGLGQGCEMGARRTLKRLSEMRK